MTATWTVNGRRRNVDVPDDMPLLWVLRDILDLKGTKFDCGMGMCGACTVHLDGQPARACLTPAKAIGTQAITTIEGIDSAISHPLHRAWIDVDVPQCGYCQAGQIMTAVALLKENPSPSDAEILQAMSGNLCRCGTYLRIREAVKRAASSGTASPTAPGAVRREGEEEVR